MSYDGNSIQVLEGLDPVRMNPGMYIGSTGSKGLHHLPEEIIANSVDESLAGACDLIKVTLYKDDSISIEDNGRGMPVEMNEKAGMPGIRLIFEKLHAGGKFGQNGYKISGGLHGVGASVVNAFSETLECVVKRNGKKYRIKYRDQRIEEELKEIGKTKETGTYVRFKPDKTMFSTTTFKNSIIKHRIKELAFLNKGLTFIFSDENSGEEETIKFDGGLSEYMKDLTEGKTVLFPQVIEISSESEVEITLNGKKLKRKVFIDAAIQYTDDYSENMYSYVNNIATIDGGTHLQGFKTALTKTINDYARRGGILKEKDQNFTAADISEGLCAVISIKMAYRPEFEGQTKGKLGNPEIKNVVQTQISGYLEEYFASHKEVSDKIVEKVLQAVKAREASKSAREIARRKSDPKQFMGKFTDASSNKREECDLYIVEGDSAGGSAKQARNRTFQAVLPLRGKSINVEKETLEKVLANKEIQVLDAAIGVGIANECDVNKARFGKIIILADADIDGKHIKNLLMTYFYRFKKPLIEAGMVYIAIPPLYKVETTSKTHYIFSDKELDEFKKALKKDKIKHIQRYKGLGEMNPDQLKETCMNPESRILKQVMVEDHMNADRLISTFMGPKSELRVKYLEEHWKKL